MNDLIEDLNGKAALVTGASSGLGRAIALRLAKAGVKVAALGRDESALADTAQAIRTSNGVCMTINTDISESGVMSGAIEQTVAEFGQLDILINNAGVMYMTPPGGAPRSRWEQMLNINLLAIIEGCDAAITHMRESGVDGRIVNITSLASRLFGGGVYGASKIAVEKYTQELRESLENDSIRVTAIIPGGFATNLGRDMSDQDRGAFAARMGDKLAAAEPDRDGRTPYFGVPDDIARAVLFAVGQPTYLNVSEMIVRPARNIDPSMLSKD